MTTIEKINFDGVGIVEKAGRGEVLTADDKIVLKAYTTLNGGRAGNAGKVAHKTRAKKGY